VVKWREVENQNTSGFEVYQRASARWEIFELSKRLEGRNIFIDGDQIGVLSRSVREFEWKHGADDAMRVAFISKLPMWWKAELRFNE